MNHKRVVSLAISREFATRFVNRHQVLFPRSWLHNPRTCLKILPRISRVIRKIYKKIVIARFGNAESKQNKRSAVSLVIKKINIMEQNK